MTKKIFRFFAGAALAGVAALACSREAMDPAEEMNSATTRTVVFRAMGSQTKAQFGQKDGETWPTLWTSNDSEVKLSLNYGSATPDLHNFLYNTVFSGFSNFVRHVFSSRR